MNKKILNPKNPQSGQTVLLTVVLSLLLGLALAGAVVSPVVRAAQTSSRFTDSRQSFYLAEAAVEDAVYRIKSGQDVNSGDTFTIGDNVATITVENTGVGDSRIIKASGNWKDTFRNIEVELVAGEGVEFNYGVQAGNGGFVITGGSTINGNVYSAGDILGDGGATITGSAIATDGSKIEGSGGSQWNQPLDVGGDAWANQVNFVDAEGEIYCQIGTGNSDGRTCNTSKPDPEPAPFPISDEQITNWKTEAEAGGVTSGNVTVGWAGATMGPQKITGDITINGGGTLTLTGPVWIQGSFTVSGGGSIIVDQSLGAKSVAIVSDGIVKLTGGGYFEGSGEVGSYPLVVTTSTCPSGAGCSNKPALSASGGSGSVVLVAQNGTLNLNGGSASRAIVGKTIRISGGGTINYETGLINVNFTSGPGGAFNILDWKEVE